jgi:hypothetical protein
MTDIFIKALMTAQNALRWYQREYPDEDSASDEELHEEIDAALLAYTSGQVPLGYAVFWGIGEMRPAWHLFKDRESAEVYAKHIKSVTEVRPVYCHSLQPLSDAYENGWRKAAKRANREDLIADIGSPAYLKDMAAHHIGEKK